MASGVTEVGVTRCGDTKCIFTSKSDDHFSHRLTDYRHHSHPLRLSGWSSVQCSCKFIRKKYLLDFH